MDFIHKILRVLTVEIALMDVDWIILGTLLDEFMEWPCGNSIIFFHLSKTKILHWSALIKRFDHIFDSYCQGMRSLDFVSSSNNQIAGKGNEGFLALTITQFTSVYYCFTINSSDRVDQSILPLICVYQSGNNSCFSKSKP